MIEFELDGKPVSAKSGATILEVALNEGKYIPHFCYHKKLSIAANCRMCLVEVEKMRNPVPACATPISEGMKVHTCSKAGKEAQQGVMEFLLINHPLDCPICDQGGECQLQDLAVGYGRSASRFNEDKRAVVEKDLGPLIQTAMTRCIHCSRCVRFSDEITGYQELAMSYRNNHVEVMPFIGKTVDSELSGNLIDVCPVGALMSKPFRDSARTWELARRKSISPHDALGSNLQVQVDKYHRVVRVLPLENEAINECWLADRDRFSYNGLYHQDRITKPMLKQDGKWLEVDWESALAYAAKSINGVKMDHGAEAIGVLASAISTCEELYLLQKMMRSLGVNNIDYRLDQQDFAMDGKQLGANYLGPSIEEFTKHKALLVVGCVLREEQPLLMQRLRQACKKGMQLHSINLMGQDLQASITNELTIDPRMFAYALSRILKSACILSGKSSTIDLSAIEECLTARGIAQSLLAANGCIALGRVARSLDNYTQLLALANELARVVDGVCATIPSLANEVGAQLVGFVPYASEFNTKQAQGLNSREILEKPRKAYVLLNTELELDSFNSQLAIASLHRAETVVVMSAYANAEMFDYADVLLPITPFSETAGSYVNMTGLWQKFNPVTRPFKDAKPAWKVLRVLANQLNVPGFTYDNIEQIRSELSNLNQSATYLSNQLEFTPFSMSKPAFTGLIRFGITGIYSGDSIVRRSEPLQATKWARQSTLAIHPQLATQLALTKDNIVQVKQAHAQKRFKLATCDKLAPNVVLLAKNHESLGFAASFAAIEINA